MCRISLTLGEESKVRLKRAHHEAEGGSAGADDAAADGRVQHGGGRGSAALERQRLSVQLRVLQGARDLLSSGRVDGGAVDEQRWLHATCGSQLDSVLPREVAINTCHCMPSFRCSIGSCREARQSMARCACLSRFMRAARKMTRSFTAVQCTCMCTKVKPAVLPAS